MPRPQSPLGLPSWLRDLTLGAFHLHRARGLSPTSGRLGFSPDWPGSPLLGSCGPGREKTLFSHAWSTPSGIPAGRCLTVNAVILDSAQPGPRAQGLAPGHRGPARWQEITVFNPFISYKPGITLIASPDQMISLSNSLALAHFAKVSACRIAQELYIANSLRTPALQRGVYSAEVQNTKSMGESLRTLWRNP